MKKILLMLILALLLTGTTAAVVDIDESPTKITISYDKALHKSLASKYKHIASNGLYHKTRK